MGSDSTQFRSVAYCQFPTFGHCAAKPVSVTVTSRQAHPSLLPPAPPLVAEAAGRGKLDYYILDGIITAVAKPITYWKKDDQLKL